MKNKTSKTEKQNYEKELKKEHCTNDICIRNMEVFYQEGELNLSTLSAIIENKGNNSLKMIMLEVKFEGSDNSFIYYIDKIDPNEKIDIDIQINKIEKKKIKDYSFTYRVISQEELDQMTK